MKTSEGACRNGFGPHDEAAVYGGNLLWLSLVDAGDTTLIGGWFDGQLGMAWNALWRRWAVDRD